MDKYSPIIDIDQICPDNILINNSNSYNIISYNMNNLYTNISLLILIRNCNIIVDKNNNILVNNTKLVNLRSMIDNAIKQYNLHNTDLINKSSEGIYVKLNFNKNISKAYLKPSKKSNKPTLLVKNKDDFIKTFSEYYPYSRDFNSNISVTADLIIQPYFLQNNNFCSLAIYDADIGYDKIKKHIINNNLSKEVTYNCSQINL